MSHRSRALALGFTLVELLVVMALLGVLGTMVMPLAEITVQRERERELKRALWQIRDAIDAYQRAAKSGGIAVPQGTPTYPASLTALVEGIADVRNPGQKLYFLRRIPRDPFAAAELSAEASWALRSYQSSPEQPQPGADVYDVASRSSRVGLNGVPLKDW